MQGVESITQSYWIVGQVTIRTVAYCSEQSNS